MHIHDLIGIGHFKELVETGGVHVKGNRCPFFYGIA